MMSHVTPMTSQMMPLVTQTKTGDVTCDTNDVVFVTCNNDKICSMWHCHMRQWRAMSHVTLTISAVLLHVTLMTSYVSHVTSSFCHPKHNNIYALNLPKPISTSKGKKKWAKKIFVPTFFGEKSNCCWQSGICILYIGIKIRVNFKIRTYSKLMNKGFY